MINNKKKKLIPELRFKEFEGEWKSSKLQDIAKFSKGKNISKVDIDSNGKYPCIRYGELYTHYKEYARDIISKTNLDKDKLVFSKTNDVIIPASGETAIDISTAVYIDKDDIALGGDLNIIRSPLYGYFLALSLSNKKKKAIARLAQGISVIHLYPEHLKTVEINYPTLPEQQKISSFLSLIDKKIELLNKKKELLEIYKKVIMHNIFNRDIRFKDSNGNDYPEWEEKRLGEIFERVIRKNKENNQNVLTISAQEGLINQETYFNKSVSALNITNYYLILSDEFAYNKSYSNGYPFGAIKRLRNFTKGVLSTLYICFKIKNKAENSPIFFEEYFESGGINREINKIAQEGARNHGLLNISSKEFFDDIVINKPSTNEQSQIADFISKMTQFIYDAAIEQNQFIIFKKGLLQKMFI